MLKVYDCNLMNSNFQVYSKYLFNCNFKSIIFDIYHLNTDCAKTTRNVLINPTCKKVRSWASLQNT